VKIVVGRLALSFKFPYGVIFLALTDEDAYLSVAFVSQPTTILQQLSCLDTDRGEV
jgi:hypothetical protein